MAKKIFVVMFFLCFMVTSLGIGFSIDFFEVGTNLIEPVTNLIEWLSSTVKSIVGW